MKILAAEGNPEMAKALRNLFESPGWDVLVVASGTPHPG